MGIELVGEEDGKWLGSEWEVMGIGWEVVGNWMGSAWDVDGMWMGSGWEVDAEMGGKRMGSG